MAKALHSTTPVPSPNTLSPSISLLLVGVLAIMLPVCGNSPGVAAAVDSELALSCVAASRVMWVSRGPADDSCCVLLLLWVGVRAAGDEGCLARVCSPCCLVLSVVCVVCEL